MKDQLKTIREFFSLPVPHSPQDVGPYLAEKSKAVGALGRLEAMAGEPVAKLHDDGYWTPMKTEAGRALNERLLRAGSPSIDVYTAAPVAQQPLTALEQYDLDQSPEYRKGWGDGRIKGYEVGYRHAAEHAAAKAQQPQAEAVPEGYRIVPDWKGYALLGSGRYLINHAANYDPELGAELIIILATEKDREGERKIGERRPTAEGSPLIQPDEMVIRIGFLNGDALFVLEDQLADVRKVLEAAGKAAPQQAEAVPLLTDDEIRAVQDSFGNKPIGLFDLSRAIEQAVRAKLGAGATMTDEAEPQLKRIHPIDMLLEVFLEDLPARPRNIINAEMAYFAHSGDEYIKPPFTVRHLLMFSRSEMRKWPNLGKKSLNEIEELLRNRGLQLWEQHDKRSLKFLREHPTYWIERHHGIVGKEAHDHN